MLTLSAWDYQPNEFPDDRLSILPKIDVVNSLSEWTLTLSIPFPLDTECYVKFYLPNDLEFARERLKGKQLFRPSYHSDIINLDELIINPQDVGGYRSVVIPACRLEEWVGFSPQGSLFVKSIGTPPAIKNSEPFRVEIYKDENLQYMLAKIKNGRYIRFDQLKPGVTGGFYFMPMDTRVQAFTDVVISFTAEHKLGDNGAFLIIFPDSMVLPEVGGTLRVVPRFDENFMQTTTGEVLLGNQVRITDIFVPGNVPDFPYTFNFTIEGVQNQRSAINAGGLNITTLLQYGDDIFYTVDTGYSGTTFVATTTILEFNDIRIKDPVTSGIDSIYTLDFMPGAGIPENGFMEIMVPPTLSMTSSNVKSSGSCKVDVICLDVIERVDPNDPMSYGKILV